MLLYYRVERDRLQKYVISLYYKGMLGQFKEMHRSVHGSPKAVNEVITHYRSEGWKIQSMASA